MHELDRRTGSLGERRGRRGRGRGEFLAGRDVGVGPGRDERVGEESLGPRPPGGEEVVPDRFLVRRVDGGGRVEPRRNRHHDLPVGLRGQRPVGDQPRERVVAGRGGPAGEVAGRGRKRLVECGAAPRWCGDRRGVGDRRQREGDARRHQPAVRPNSTPEHRDLPRRAAPHDSANAESNCRLLGAKSRFFTNRAASAAPCSRSMPQSSHSTESGPS